VAPDEHQGQPGDATAATQPAGVQAELLAAFIAFIYHGRWTTVRSTGDAVCLALAPDNVIHQDVRRPGNRFRPNPEAAQV
jgi:hypothetical protein